MLEYVQENQKLSELLAKVSAEIADWQVFLRERSKDQMALRNAASRLAFMNRQTVQLKSTQHQLEEECVKVEHDRDDVYNSFEENIRRVEQ